MEPRSERKEAAAATPVKGAAIDSAPAIWREEDGRMKSSSRLFIGVSDAGPGRRSAERRPGEGKSREGGAEKSGKERGLTAGAVSLIVEQHGNLCAMGRAVRTKECYDLFAFFAPSRYFCA